VAIQLVKNKMRVRLASKFDTTGEAKENEAEKKDLGTIDFYQSLKK